MYGTTANIEILRESVGRTKLKILDYTPFTGTLLYVIYFFYYYTSIVTVYALS